MAIPTDIKERTAADLSAAANDFLSRMAKLGLTASGFLPGLARGMIKAGALRKEDFNVDSPAPDQRASLKALLARSGSTGHYTLRTNRCRSTSPQMVTTRTSTGGRTWATA